MKTPEAAKVIGQILSVNTEALTPKEIYNKIEQKNIPMPQVNAALKLLVDDKNVSMDETESGKKYSLTVGGELLFADFKPDSKLVVVHDDETPKNIEEDSPIEPATDDDKKKVKSDQKIKDIKTIPIKVGRDLTKYTFNGESGLNKGRLALAIIRQISIENPKLKYKQLLEVFPDEIVPPYGVIKDKKEALEASKARPRFFIKEEEMIKLADATICVSNQWMPDRLEAFLKKAKEAYSIKVKIDK